MEELKSFDKIVRDAKEDYEKQKRVENSVPLSELCRELGIIHIN